ncbi:MAG: type II toxin-antitoxin system RelE/ParE family toxin [Bacteroidota bacterium]
MSYTLRIEAAAKEQIYQQALYYQEQFSSGLEDFIGCVEDTGEFLSQHPYVGRKVGGKPETVRILPLRAKSAAKRKAKNFPFSLVYRIDEDQQTCFIYQLWPQRSRQDIQDPPDGA